MTAKLPGDSADTPKSANRPHLLKQAKALLAEVGGSFLLPGDPNGPAGPSGSVELGRPEGEPGVDPSARTVAKGPTGPSDTPDDIGLASANGPGEP